MSALLTATCSGKQTQGEGPSQAFISPGRFRFGVATSSGNPGSVFSPRMCSGTRGSWAWALAQLPPLPPQIMSALEANPTARRTQLQHKFEQVVALMEDNIYECYSEA